VVEYFHPGTPTGSVADQTAAFRKGLAEIGFVEGRNVTVEYSYGNNENDRITELIGDLVRRRLNVLVIISAGAALAAKAITTAVPIVFLTAVDPVQLGFVAGFGRPGGNLTGVSVLTGELGAKRLQVMRDMLPAAARFALLVSSLDGQIAQIAAREMLAAAASIARDLDIIAVGSNDEINTAFARIAENRVEAVLITPSTLFLNRRVHLSTIAARHRIPVIFPDRQYVEAGGLMSYGPNVQDQYRQMGLYAGRILKGEKPADLPIIQPTKFELVINLTTAKVIGLTISPSLLALADEVIE